MTDTALDLEALRAFFYGGIAFITYFIVLGGIILYCMRKPFDLDDDADATKDE